MKKYSYPFLFAATISFLIVVFLFIVWKREIYQITFLRVSTNRCMIVSAMVLSLFISLYFINKGAVKSNKYIDYLKFYGGACVSLLFIFLIPIITITYLVPGQTSSYTIHYSYASGSYKSCSGADVDDPDLGTNIRICYPGGNYESDRVIFVQKRSNALGAVVLHATTSP